MLNRGNPSELRSLFAFKASEDVDMIVLKFNLWSRYFFPDYFTSDDASFHHKIDSNNVNIYIGKLNTFTNIAFRGAAKTARTKLFFAFAICNDLDRYRKYYKVLAEDIKNSVQISTDVYNMLVSPPVAKLYPEIFAKTSAKREERRESFTTSTGIKVLADTVGTKQRGALQEHSRPDMLWFEDFENRATLRSARRSIAIWDNMEEARTGLSSTGGCLYTCNYISENGNVHKLVEKEGAMRKVLIIPILTGDNESAWSRYSLEDIEYMRKNDEDFDGERMCKPSASKDLLFDRETLEHMRVLEPIKITSGFKIYKDFRPGHRYAGGMDVSGGVGLDSSASVFIDFDTIPAQVVGTYVYDKIKPESFGDEIYRESLEFGKCLVCPERNYGAECILRLKQLEANIHVERPSDFDIRTKRPSKYGWYTSTLSKPKMLNGLVLAIQDGLLVLNDKDLIKELKSYTRNDMMDREVDVRLTTRHFDMLIACAIAWQMREFATVAKGEEAESYLQAMADYANKPVKHAFDPNNHSLDASDHMARYLNN